jgi:PQQ-dependent catabolism-associated CXXCW motif protein
MACWLAYPPAAPADPAALEHIGPQGLRMERYRAPTPLTVPHAQTLGTGQLLSLMRDADPVLIDVQPVVVRPETREFGMEWLPATVRYHIAGSAWLPNVGFGELEPRMERYFRDSLRQLTAGDPGRAVVFYCVLDCWMSWNAVQRAAAYGYGNLYWYRGGTDEWEQHGQPVVEATPVPIGDAGTP